MKKKKQIKITYPICPGCKANLETLAMYQRIDFEWAVVEYLCGEQNEEPFIDGGPGGYRDSADTQFRCPYCNKTLFTDFDDAFTFMRIIREEG